MRKIIVSAGCILVVFGLVFLINRKIGEKKTTPTPKVTVIKNALVKTLFVKNEEIIPSITVQGKVNPSEVVKVALEGKGTLGSSLLLKKGTKFRKGQTIVYVDDVQSKSNFKSLLANYEKNLTQIMIDIEVEHPDELSKWKSFRSSIKAGLLVELPSSSNNKLNNLLSSKGIFKEYYDLKAIQATVSKRSYRAPFNGVITETMVQVGSFVNGNTVVCEIIPSNKREVSFSVPEEFSAVKIGSFVTIKSGERAIKGKVSRESTVLNASSQQKELFVRFSNVNLKIDEFVDVTINTSKQKVKAVLLANPLVYKKQVFGISKDSTLNPMEINIVGIRNDSLIVTGLTDKSRLLSEAYTNFQQGQKVRF